MSPVHVIVGEDERAEAMWAAAFTGAVDLYRFPRNVDAFERLTAAEAPIDLVVLTPAQQGPFNMSPEQFIARVLEGPLGASRWLANLHVIVVGQQLDRQHPRVMAVSTLDAAIRLVKFGEIERAPRPEAPKLPLADSSRRSAPALGLDPGDSLLRGAGLAGSIISRIWDAPDPEPAAPSAPAPQPRRSDVVGGGAKVAAPAPAPAPASIPPSDAASANPQLFARSVAAGFVVAPSMPPMPAPAADPAHQHVVGGGSGAALVGAPGEAIEVATGTLQPARPYQLPNGGGYRGPATKGGQPNPAHHGMAAAGGHPVPPALASQIQSMVYGGMVGNPSDPLLTWSSSARTAATPIPTDAVATQGYAPAVVPPAAPAPGLSRNVPMEPPPGAYGTPSAAAPMASTVQTSDPFMRRAEQGGGDVAFG